jgi:hypothetical protein
VGSLVTDVKGNGKRKGREGNGVTDATSPITAEESRVTDAKGNGKRTGPAHLQIKDGTHHRGVTGGSCLPILVPPR